MGRRVALEENQMSAVVYMRRALASLKAAELTLSIPFPAETIALSYRAMLMAARSILDLRGRRWDSEWEISEIFIREILPSLDLTKENQRALKVVKSLVEKVDNDTDEEADPLTAKACMSDASQFVGELRRILGKEQAEGKGDDGGED